MVAGSLLTCVAAVSVVCGSSSGPRVPSWARPDDARLTRTSACKAGARQCYIEYLTNTPWETMSETLSTRLERRGWSVQASSAGLGATQFLRAEPPDADVCLYYSFIPNIEFQRPTPSVEPGLDFRADELRLRSQYSLIVSITARGCYVAEP